jgi:arylsulfatase A-like enzyme
MASPPLRFARTLLALLALGLCCADCGGAPRGGEISLVDEFPFARTQPVIAGTGNLGSCTYRPFLAPGLSPDAHAEWVAPLPGVRDVSIGFFLHDVVPVEVALEGKLSSRGLARDITFSVGQQVVEAQPVGPDLRIHRLRLKAAWLKPGMNWLTIRQAGGTQWLSMRVSLSGGGRSMARDEPVPAQRDVSGDAVLLPFGNRVEVALTADQESSLQMEVEPWVEAGAPPLDAGSWTLRVELADEPTPYRLVAKTSSEGALSVSLPTAHHSRALALKAVFRGKQAPLPGELGLRLRKPRLLTSSAATTTPPGLASATPPPMAGGAAGATSASRPNVLVYLVDTLRADRLGCYGNSKPTSPRLDQMVAESVIYDGAMSTAPWTKPSVASLMTGTEPALHGVVDFMDSLPSDLVTFAEVFQGNGYRTQAVVANPLVGRQFNYGQGFEQYREVSYQRPASESNKMVFPWLDSLPAGQPFLLYVHTLDPHIPYRPPLAFRKAWLRSWHKPAPGNPSKAILRSTRDHDWQALSDELKRRSFEVDPAPIPQATYDNLNALYEGELATNDAAFGELLDHLKEKGLYDNTLIVFVSDHGEEILDRGKLGHMHKLYQELMHIPLVVKYPHGRGGGQRIGQLCQIVDVMPTILGQAGLPVPRGLAGRPLPLAESPELRPLFFDIEAGRQGQLAHQPEGNYLIDARGVRLGQWTAAVCRAGNFLTDPFVLFDLQADPGERHNLWLQHPVRALELESLIRRYDARRNPSKRTNTASPEETERMLRSLQYLR